MVFRGFDRAGKEEIAIKVLKDGLVRNKCPLEEQIREAKMIKSMSHPNIINLVAIFEIPNNGKGFAFSCMDHDLFDELKDSENVIKVDRVHRITQMILSACEHMHSRYIVHKDLKPSNVLVDHTGEIIKVCDFGLSAQLKPGLVLTSGAGTRAYQAPEIFMRYHDEKVDIWLRIISLFCTTNKVVPSKFKN